MSAPIDIVDGGLRQERFPKPLRVLHWSIAALVVVQFSLILILKNLQALNFGAAVLELHQQCGLVVLALILTRFALGVRFRAPRNEGRLPAWQSLAARVVHGALMGALAAQPALGLLTGWARGEQIVFLHIVPLPAPFALSTETGVMLQGYHAWLAYGMLGLLVVHIGAVVFNRMMRSESVIERMLAEPATDRFVNRVPLVVQLLLCCGGILTMTMGAGLYSAYKYSEFNSLRGQFEDQVVSKFDALHDAQLSAHDMVNAPAAEAAGAVRDAINDALPAMREESGLPDAKAAAAGFDRIAKGDLSPALAVQASASLDNAVMGLAMDVFQRRLEISQSASEGHDMIVLVLAPTVLLSTVIAFMLSRSILAALAHARSMVSDVARGRHALASRTAVEGEGEFAVLLRDIALMEAAVTERERERHEAEARKSQLIVDRLAEALAALARGNLTYRISEAFPDATERVRDDFNAAIYSLEEAMQVLVESSQAIDAGAGTVRNAAENLVLRNEQQANDITNTAMIFAKMSDAVDQSASDASTTRDVMNKVCSGVLGAGEIFDQAIAAMSDVESSSHRIMEIVALIDQIALQTNMLALNAGVEAARAGDAGKGFAIVAGEVRQLASRTGSAAAQVRELIDTSGQHITRGAGLVRRSGEAMEEITSNMASVDELISRIAATAKLQASEIREVNRSIQKIDDTVQENAAMAEETNAAINGICQNTARLNQHVARFEIDRAAAGETMGSQFGHFNADEWAPASLRRAG